MNYGIIDVGSNSVRLLITDGVFFNKHVEITKLSEGMGENCVLSDFAVKRTVNAICNFVSFCREQNIKNIYVFATEAVRKAKNKKDFIDEVYLLTGIKTDIIDGETEAELGAIGVLSGKDGGVIDIGGASSEIIVKENGATVYSKSVDMGAVKVKDFCGQDIEKNTLFVKEKIKSYGNVPNAEFYAIGGTATSLASLSMELEPYDPEKVNGYVISLKSCIELESKLFSLSVEQRKHLKGLQPQRAEIIASGCSILKNIMQSFGIDKITVSEHDNLEGYFYKKVKND